MEEKGKRGGRKQDFDQGKQAILHSGYRRRIFGGETWLDSRINTNMN